MKPAFFIADNHEADSGTVRELKMEVIPGQEGEGSDAE